MSKPPRETEEWCVSGIIKRTNGDIPFNYVWSSTNGASLNPRKDALSYVSLHQWVRPPRVTYRKIIVHGWEEFHGENPASS